MDNQLSYLRPSLLDACMAFDMHIEGLLDQHRVADELSETEYFELVQWRYAARDACSLGLYTEGIAIYERIPIHPFRGRLLR